MSSEGWSGGRPEPAAKWGAREERPQVLGRVQGWSGENQFPGLRLGWGSREALLGWERAPEARGGSGGGGS